MKKYKIYMQTGDGKQKKTIWSNTLWIHKEEDNIDWYATKIKKYGIFAKYILPLSVIIGECANCPNNDNPIEIDE